MGRKRPEVLSRPAVLLATLLLAGVAVWRLDKERPETLPTYCRSDRGTAVPFVPARSPDPRIEPVQEYAAVTGREVPAAVTCAPGPCFSPSSLALPPGVGPATIHKASAPSEAIRIPYPVSMALRKGHEYYVCNYAKLYLVNLEERRAWEVPPPKGLTSLWVPTALAYDDGAQKLYVATYTGGNVLVLDATEPTRVTLAGVIAHPDMKGPEGVALSHDRRHVAVADYDGGKTMLFDAGGNLLWHQPARGCHGVAFGRLKDGRQTVCSTSLSESAVCQFDMQGKLLKKVMNRNWIERDGYLYPTALVACKDGTIAVTDAFRGQIGFLDGEIQMVDALGGNGPGACFFNNPYACCWDECGKKLLVVDTFKDRIVAVDPHDKSIDGIFHFAADTSPAAPGRGRRGRIARLSSRLRTVAARLTHHVLPLPPRFDRDSELESLPHTPLKGPYLGAGRAFGMSYVADGDPGTTVVLPLPRFTAAVASQGGTEWHPRLNGLYSAAHPTFVASCVGLGGLFTEYPYRFVLGSNYEFNGETYLLLTSPQCKDVLVCGRGVTVPLPVHKDLWLTGDDLVGPDFVLSAALVVELGAVRIAAYLRRLADHPPLTAIRVSFFPGLSEAEFALAFKTAMVTPAGKAFARACIWAGNTEDQCAAAERYLEYCKTQENNYLSELFMAEMILCAKNNARTPAHPTGRRERPGRTTGTIPHGGGGGRPACGKRGRH